MNNPDDLVDSRDPAARQANANWRKVLHQLNNIFASIHSSLDLALANEGRPEGHPFLVQAQESARRGAVLINEMRLTREPSGGESRGESPEPKAGESSGAAAMPEPASLEGSERILLVEDDESVRLLVRAVLTYRGYEIAEACDGEEAVRKYRELGPFDLVILDLHMPKLDGREALELLRAADPNVRALALSGSAYEGESLTPGSDAAAFDARLNKPFDNTELVTLVRRLLDGPAQR